MRYETISAAGISYFEEEVNRYYFLLAELILDHKEKKVLKARDGNPTYEQACSVSHISEEVRKRAFDTPYNPFITKKEWDSMRLNSYERVLLYPLMSNELLVEVIEQNILPNCSPSRTLIPTSYDDAAIHCFLPLLVKRMKALTTKV